MRMDTDQLIRTLAADNTYRARPVGVVLALAFGDIHDKRQAAFVGLHIRHEVKVLVLDRN